MRPSPLWQAIFLRMYNLLGICHPNPNTEIHTLLITQVHLHLKLKMLWPWGQTYKNALCQEIVAFYEKWECNTFQNRNSPSHIIVYGRVQKSPIYHFPSLSSFDSDHFWCNYTSNKLFSLNGLRSECLKVWSQAAICVTSRQQLTMSFPLPRYFGKCCNRKLNFCS